MDIVPVVIECGIHPEIIIMNNWPDLDIFYGLKFMDWWLHLREASPW